MAPMRVYWNDLNLRYPIIASSQDADYPATNLDTGDLKRYWRATSTAAQTLGRDATSGFTASPNALVIAGADYLVQIGANVDLRWNTTGAAAGGTSIGALTNGMPPFPWEPITSAHLVAPYARDAVAEWTAVAKRSWWLHIYGTVSAPARLPGGLFLGTRTELPKSPSMPGRGLGAPRTYRGRDIETSWPPMSLANAKAIAELVATLTDDVGQGFVETIDGVAYGGLPAWLYDQTGKVFNGLTGAPYALPVMCASPSQSFSTSIAHDIDQAPVTVRWRERR